MRLFIVFLGIVLCYLQFNFWFNRGGWNNYQAVKSSLEPLRIKNAELTARNNLLKAEVQDLKKGISALEERARFEREMVKSNEVFYRIIPRNQGAR